MSKKVKEDVPMNVTPVPDMDEIKKVIGQLLQNFTQEEAGNKVTSNNMAGLAMNLMGALDGNITLKPPEEGTK